MKRFKRIEAPDEEPIAGPRPWADLAEPAEPGIQDLGPEILEMLVSGVAIDDEWIIRSGRTATLWGGPLPLELGVELPGNSLGDPMVKITSRVTLAENVDDADQAMAALSVINATSSAAALSYVAEHRSIQSTTSFYAHDGNRAAWSIYGMLMLLQYIEATAKAPSLTEVLGGQLPFSAHPSLGVRTELDEIMGWSDQRAQPAGLVPNRWPTSDIAITTASLRQAGVLATDGPTGVTAEFPFIDNLPVAVQALADEPSGPTTSLFEQMYQQPHPGYGTGLLCTLRLPASFAGSGAATVANELNRAEASELTGFPAWGAWCVEPGNPQGVAHTSFLPNITAAQGFAGSVAWYGLLRGLWVSERLAHDPRWE